MGAPESGMEAAGQPTADTLLTAFRTIKAPERAKHGAALEYWLSIRGDKEFPPLHDLDPLEISDAGPSSILFELIGGGQDAEVRHLGDALAGHITAQRVIDAPNPSLLASIARKLPIVAISRDFLAFEDSFDSAGGWTRCWVTLLPLSSCGSWVDYVYAFVSVETGGVKATKTPEPDATPAELPAVDEPSPADAAIAEPEIAEPEIAEAPEEPAVETVEEAPAAGFSKLIEGIANLTGFYGQGIQADPVVNVELPVEQTATTAPPATEPEPEQLDTVDPAAEEVPDPEPDVTEPVDSEPMDSEPEELVLEAVAQEADGIEPTVEETPARDVEESEIAPAPIAASPMEGALQKKLSDVRATADEARLAQLRATAALHEGLSAAYDFALDAEGSPEEYLRLVEAQGMKIQLRAPMAPVVKLAFNGLADDATIAELETVLAWALKQELPRGSLAQRIEAAGGIDALLNGA